MAKVKAKKPRSNSFWAKLRRLTWKLIMWFFIISIGWVILARFVPVLVTPLMLIRSVEAIADGEKPKIVKKWVPIEEISPNMIQAVVASEDNLFMQHNGFSFKDIEKAIEHNKKGKRIRGGSTISQQTAKNVFLWPQRSWIRKGLEAYFTILIEFFWTKERIMEVYLNIIETGDGIYGVQAAAQTYFNKDAKKLTKSQSALIAVCLPNPRKFNPAKPSPYINRRKNQIVSLMGKIEKVDFD
ncbi:MAG TPA: monofunctional biosynthetic peptidoglycan transglycosylase [Bacteroidales bacterium]|nr:monofunctional biosynthetic peptidoglycan transglycosylase [Bacteroidales bacterium]